METVVITNSSSRKQQQDAGESHAGTAKRGPKCPDGSNATDFRHTDASPACGHERQPATSLRLHVAVTPRRNPISRRVREVCHQFGMAPHPSTIMLIDNLSVPLEPGRILLVTGPSGTGKSATLRCVAKQLADRAIWVSGQQPHNKSAIVDQVAPDRPLAEAISILTACGLGEPRLWLRRFPDLSDGEQSRVRLAMAVSAAMKVQAAARSRLLPVLIADEFCAVLHRRLACAMAFNLRKLISSSGLSLVVATTHDDLQADLQPDLLLRLGGPAPDLQAYAPVARPISFFRRLHISPGRVSDYKFFESMHYRQREGLGPIDSVFVLRDGVGGEPLGVVVYGYPPLSLRLRNRVTASAYHRNGKALNRDFRILRRLVIHPDIRGCGLAHYLVARTLPKVTTRYVECLAAMGAVNPVFERAGMLRLGLAGLPVPQQRAGQALAALHVDPLAGDFQGLVARRSAVRNIVARSVRHWLQATTGRPVSRIRAMTSRQLAAAYLQLLGTQPVYYLWSSDAQEMARLRHEELRLRADDNRDETRGRQAAAHPMGGKV
jgi:ABC-type ATPase involved in cell division